MSILRSLVSCIATSRRTFGICAVWFGLACTLTPPTERKPDRPESADTSRRASEDALGAPRASCGDVVCSDETPICCAKVGKSWCVSEKELEDGACPIDGEHYQLRCGAKKDCRGDRCCYFNQMSNCAESCPHLGELCETADDCSAMAVVTGNTAKCLTDDHSVPFLRSCSERATLPEKFRLLGQPCDPAKPEGPPMIPGSITCSREGRVSGVYQAVDFLPAPPVDAVILSEPKEIVFASTAYVALDGETIWIRRVTCGGCRRIVGWSFIGNVSELSLRQLLTLQSDIGLEATVPALESAAEWQKQPMPSLVPSR